MNYNPSNFSLELPHENISGSIQEILRASAVESVSEYLLSFTYSPWLFSLLGSFCVGLCGVFPLLIIPVDDAGENLKSGDGAKKLRVLLSFAVGGLLGDVFLHLLPEAWENRSKNLETGQGCAHCGVWVLIGMLAFIIIEKVFSNMETSAESDVVSVNDNNNKPREKETHAISGYLNLAANSIDNFTHGLAIGTSFCISLKLGMFSTFAILVHELPHEVGDFAILLRSGFSRWEAARAQVMTASAGICGSMVAVICGATDASASWIAPFTAGGFLHIALVSCLPDLIREESRVESAKQICSLVTGIAVMAGLIVFFD